MAWAVGLVWATQAWFSPNTQAQILTLFFSASRRWYFDFLNQSQMIFSTSSDDGFAGKLVCLSEPPGILHWSSFEYWCQWTIWQVEALVDNDMPLSLSSISLSMKMWQFQENDFYFEQFGADALLHHPFLRSQFSNFDRCWVLFTIGIEWQNLFDSKIRSEWNLVLLIKP